jgi:hypothetical protein
MTKLPELKLPPIDVRLRRTMDGVQVFDALRGKWLVLTPEEWVRRHVVGLLERMGYSVGQIAQEVSVDMYGADQRADVVAYDLEGVPVVLCECKEPKVEIKDSSVLDQAVRYNHIIGASVVFLSNGLEHFVYECREGNVYQPITIPEFLERYKIPNL